MDRDGNIRALAGRYKPGRVIDLGTSTGHHALMLADMGWVVTATDARHHDWPAHPFITWRQEDVRETDLRGYDLILCSGLFYHLDYPDQVRLLEACYPRPVILDTHIWPGAPDVAVDDNITGFHYSEPDDALASWGNPVSFWPDLESLRRMALNAHYLLTACEPWYAPDRTTFLLEPA